MIVTEHWRIKQRWSPCGKRETSQDYYAVRDGSTDYTDYWNPKADPDGNVRDRTTREECQQFLADHAEELHRIDYMIKPRTVLEVGAGLGWMLDHLIASHKWAIERCEKMAEALRNAGVLIVDDLADLNSNWFDLVICHHVIEHMIDPLYAIGHMHRVLKKGAWLMMSTPDFGSPCAKRFGDKFRLLHDKTHISLFTVESMSRCLRDYGFTIKEILFPFPDRYATPENFARWNDTSKVSPPWPGNVFTMFATRD